MTTMAIAPAARAAACSPFKVHRQAKAPPPPAIQIPTKFPAGWEADVVDRIAGVHGHQSFPEIFRRWKSEDRGDTGERERYEWLHCLDHHVHLDSDADGLPDWSAISDDQPARALFPYDSDQDGDGLENILDPDPLRAGSGGGSAGVPPHLRIDALKRPEEASLQMKLFDEFGIIAVDHTDEHDARVLRELIFILERGFDKSSVKTLAGLRYVYAFSGHDSSRRVAAFHRQARALSIGGKAVYQGIDLGAAARFELLSTFAHEIGHAVLFERLSVRSLAAGARRFAEWPGMASLGKAVSFFSQVFFRPFAGAAKSNMVSGYARSNVHEWFAESFAAHTMLNLAERGALTQRDSLFFAKRVSEVPDRWTEYRNLSPACRSWLTAAFR